MKHSRTIIRLFVIMLFCSLTALAQTPGNTKHFDKDGLAFDYPNNWGLNDSSNTDAQQLTLGREGSDAQVKMFVHRGRVDTPERVTQARSKLIDPYVEATANSFTQMGAKPTRTPANIEIGGAQAEGVRLRAVLDGEPGEAAIYWVVLGNRLVVLTFFGPDKALKQSTPGWDILRNSLHIEEIKPAQKTAPK